MTIDHSFALIANPTAFIAANPIALDNIASLMPHGIPALNNIQANFTLTQDSAHGLPAPGSVPKLKMLPGLFAGGLSVDFGGHGARGAVPRKIPKWL